MADRLRVTELDFDTIKQNLKVFLKQQNEFTDYDFEGSGLNVLLDILAYNTHYNAYYLNMVANESFLDTAMLRDSVVSHAKTLGYTPYSRKSSTATINLEIDSESSSPGSLTLPRGFRFFSNQIDGRSFNFIVLQDVTVTKSNTKYVFENLPINEGELITYRYVYDELSNPKQIFTLPSENVDVSTLKVLVSPGIGNTQIALYEQVNDITEINRTSEIYFLQENRDGKYQIYFGNDILGKKLPDGSVLNINYLITNSSLANKANNFVAAVTVIDSNQTSLTNFIVNPVFAANGGAERESVDEIKYGASLQYASQNRLVTYKDYEIYIRNSYPNLDSISIWGGEDEVPPIYGKIFISLKPKDNFYISETEKERIIQNIIEPKSVVTIKTEFRDPEYLFINTVVNVQYNANKTSLSNEALKNSIRNAILNYKNLYLDKFNSKFAISKLQESIDSVDLNSIIGSDATIRVQKRFAPTLGRVSNYQINFNLSLLQGTTFNKLTSTEFGVNDAFGILRTVSIEEVPKSFTGINSIEIQNTGINYTSEPKVTITGDGFGATARAILSFGKIQRIEVLNPGIDYNQAVVTITGGGGFGALATAVIDTNIGKLRSVYYTESVERVIVDSDVGIIDYENGIITLTDLNIINVKSTDGLIRVDCGIENNIIQSSRNTILTIDEFDNSSISINLTSV